MAKIVKFFLPHLVVFLAISILLSFTGCSLIARKITEKAAEKAIEKETGKDVDLNVGEGKVKIKGKEGETEIQSGEKLPEDFPEKFPLYPQAEVKGTVRNEAGGKIQMQVVLETKDSFDKVVDFYKEKLPESGYKITSTVQTGGGAMFYLEMGKDKAGIVSIIDEKTKTTFTINLQI